MHFLKHWNARLKRGSLLCWNFAWTGTRSPRTAGYRRDLMGGPGIFGIFGGTLMKYRAAVRALLTIILVCISFSLIQSIPADDGDHVVTVDHYVPVQSIVPSMAGQIAQIYVRERTQAGLALRSASLTDRVVLFVHGAGTPAEVAFDVPYQDYSWMAYLAQAGFDVFAMDTTGYGRSTRPTAMNDPCNLTREQQAAFVPNLMPAECEPSYTQQMTPLESYWHDIDSVVDYMRALRHVDRVTLFGWSLGGPRAAGYGAQHPEKVQKLV